MVGLVYGMPWMKIDGVVFKVSSQMEKKRGIGSKSQRFRRLEQIIGQRLGMKTEGSYEFSSRCFVAFLDGIV